MHLEGGTKFIQIVWGLFVQTAKQEMQKNPLTFVIGMENLKEKREQLSKKWTLLEMGVRKM